MKISREVNGQVMEFELTAEEVLSAYQEQEHKYDCKFVERGLEDYCENKDLFESNFYVPFDFLWGNDELVSDIAYEMRHYVGEYDMDMSYARYEAIKDVLRKQCLEAFNSKPEITHNSLDVQISEAQAKGGIKGSAEPAKNINIEQEI